LTTGGWGLSLDASHYFPLYDSAFASDFCGGLPSVFNLNYGFYCNNAFDVAVEKGEFNALTVSAFNLPHQTASNIAADDRPTIPVHSRASRTLHHSDWDGVVDVKGDGFANTFNWFSARSKPGCDGTYNGQGGNPKPCNELYRAGFRQGTSKLNIFHAGTVWEAYIIFNILDGLMGGNPRSATAPFFDQYETGAKSVSQAFNTFGVDQIPGNADDEPVTVIDIKMRNDLFFHDGVQVTFDDFIKTQLALRDVPQGGFGCAGCLYHPLVAWSDPIPGSNCEPLCGRLVFDRQTFMHKLNFVGSAILPIHLWDAGVDGIPGTGDAGEGDGFVCSSLGIASCAGLPADGTTDVNYDPMTHGIMIGHGPFMCLNLVTGRPGGSCSRTSDGVQGGQSIGAGGSFTLTRYDGYYLGAPIVPGSPICNFATADVNDDWKVDGTDLALALDTAAEPFVLANFDFLLGGTQRKTLHGVDTTNAGNACPSTIP
jgi:hypothetical protein